MASTALIIIESVALACLAILCVGRSWRSALIVLLSVAVSIAATLELVVLSGGGLTPVTLLGTALTILLFLDDGVAVRESIVRHVERGLDPRRAASAGASSVIPGLAFGSLAVCAMFGLVLMVGGDSGRWFGGVGMVAMAAAGASLLVSATLIPPAWAIVARASKGGHDRARSARLDLWLERVADTHHDLLAWSIGHRRVMAGAALGIAGIVAGILASVVKTDTTSHSIELTLQGPDAETLSGVAQRVADELRRVDGMRDPVVSPTVHGGRESLARIDHIDGERTVRVRTSVGGRRVSDVVR
ncbi:MAG TPA: efflux RND transporter permease subunit, partial [Gemmatimonadaceae bacterium]|nr:efflux RND transporter permease subunit [Gemmatimonadaceae bacterium]